ncbi:uncharacterized protein LOC119085544 [Bradysia coprophila]|uniref:uncharacterized protein LOC119085544 n=1 Tax=Bradysia coprophila TaxID=38358 RepID=UPI00187DBA0F|nr:uncharacterized protein LOC119085544 [Bradysia coprophila]
MDLQAPLPPPPPPPTNGMLFSNSINHHQHQSPINLNTTRNMSDRSQLLIDIERGTTLKKVSESQNGLNSRYMNQIKQISSSNECNGIDNNNYSEDAINPIKNQLQAELSSTLHRRQTGGNKKPNFIAPKNTTINAINNQLRELQNNAQNQPITNGKTATDAKQTKPSTDDKDKEEKPKLLISHGKPNFKISSNGSNSKKLLEKDENVSGNELIGTLRRRLKSVEALDEIEPAERSNDKSVNEPKFVPEPKVVVAEPTKIVRQPQKIVQEQTNVFNSVPKSPIAPPLFYKASVKNFSTVTSNTSATDGNSEIKRTIRRLKSVELLEQTEKSTDDKTELNDIQRRIQNLKNVEIHKINSSSNGFTSEVRTDEHHRIESISVRSTTETDCFQSSPILPRRAQLFKQQQNLENSKITSPTIHHINHGNSNYKVKPITSFARDLQLEPNRYPDTVAVTKTAEPEPVFFSDIKFIINSNGEVVRS